MEDAGSAVTLIFYRMSPRWWKEPALNVISAAAQMSALTHVEISIGGERARLKRRGILLLTVRVCVCVCVCVCACAQRRPDKAAP